MTKNNRRRGFTLIELMVVVFALTTLAALSWPVFQGTYRGLTASLAEDDVMAAFAYARERAVMTSQNHRIVIDAAGTSYQIEAQDAAGFQAVQDGLGLSRALPDGMKIDSAAPPVLFSPQGTSSPATLVLTFQGESRGVIKINPLLGKARFERAQP
jgi:prepilin-type N-terminal cleavage/methylation domain-containing protein